MGLLSVFGRAGRRAHRDARPLYEAACAQGRSPEFYSPGLVPDTVEGRFEAIMLHVYLLVRRLKAEPGAAPVSQALFDVFFDDMDAALREIGVGDLVVGKKIKKMGEAFYGRAKAYEDALESGEPAQLRDAVRRNLLADAENPPEPAVERFAQYIAAASEALAQQDLDSLLAGAAPAFPRAPA